MIIQENKQKVIARIMVLAAVLCFSLFAVIWVVRSAVDNEFVAYEHNPVLELGNAGEWDGGTIILPEVIVVSDTFHLFYAGLITAFNSAPTLGYAYSTNGLTWTKHISNPMLAGDGSGFDAYYAATPALLYDDGLWVMYYAGQPAPPPFPNGSQIGRATAADPGGPWARAADPVLMLGGSGAWDEGFIEPNTVLKTEDGYVMYYSGGSNFLSFSGFMIGMATSSDGVSWTKFNDPTTTDAPFAESDPVLMPGAAGAWDDTFVWHGHVRHTHCGWEMYYSGEGSSEESEPAIGYATSANGVVWAKSADNPIYTRSDDPVAASYNSNLEIPAVIDVGYERWMYYDYGQGDDVSAAVGLAAAPLSCHSIYLPLVNN